MEELSQLENVRLKQERSFSGTLIAIVLFCLSVLTAFSGGYYLKSTMTPQSSPLPSPSISSSDQSSYLEENSTGNPGSEYYDDTIMAISKIDPRKIIVATTSRQGNSDGGTQSSRVSYFDGQLWTRKTLSTKNPSTGIFTNDLITKWTINIDPTRVLKQSTQGSLKVNQTQINFDTGVITNNIGMRSLPGYTKFISTGIGKIDVNGSNESANILYTRIYSNNSAELQFYESPIDLTTHWLAFWDERGNVYHLDSTAVDNPTTIYQTHQLGVWVDKDGKVSKTFDVTVNPDSNNPPKNYQIKFGHPINKELIFSIDQSINKAPNNSYSWFMSNGVGKLDDGVEGYGIVEYIHH